MEIKEIQNLIKFVAKSGAHEVKLETDDFYTITKRILERRTLEKRIDDNEEIAIKRYKTYEKSTEPVIEYYKKLNLLKVIDGERPIDQINKEISDIIGLI